MKGYIFMTLLKTKGAYYHFNNNGSIISVHKNDANHNLCKAIELAISRLNDVNDRFKKNEGYNSSGYLVTDE